MYVGDRDTYDDVFCQDCGRIADRQTLTADGLCEDCQPMTEERKAEIVSVESKLYVILTRQRTAQLNFVTSETSHTPCIPSRIGKP